MSMWICLIIGFIAGFILGKIKLSDATIERLRKRGYSIKTERQYYGNTYHYFVYTGFTKNLKPIKVVGENFTSYDDAVANADAHYYMRMTTDIDDAKIV